MSLSFVKSAVLSSTDGVAHDTEQSIDNPETTSLRKSAAHKPLFEQLRANKEEEQERYEELQRQMRGTRTLDDEDCAHLDAVERVKLEKEMAVRNGIEREVALFHAARVDRGLARASMDEDGTEELVHQWKEEDRPSSRGAAAMGAVGAVKKETKLILPKIVLKKKRKRSLQTSHVDDATERPSAHTKTKNYAGAAKGDLTKNTCSVTSASVTKQAEPKPANDSDSESDPSEGGGLLGLGCYGSDTD